ncbi:MAG TPA: 2-oxo acid dehydrogenase subunit E2 [Gemmatimonadales bacterium]|jgi:2-oxoglutarate dehydrogenase E2 component (dihydrolipoamide succinyltransferase)|nr:2-oxo acid dehydrogenase subunit E2 [Gemmatimonadales bacterium]
MPQFTDIVLPSDQSEGTSHTVGKWFKAVGDTVHRDDPLLEIVTDKVTVEIAAPADGVLAEIVRPEGESVEEGAVLGRLAAGAAAGTSSPGRTAPAASAGPGPARPSGRPPTPAEAHSELSPAVRRLLKEHGLDPAKVAGTGRGGRITVQDVEGYLEGAREPGSQGAGAAQAAATAAGRNRMVPHTVMRRSIAKHMVQSVQAAPHVTAVFEADLTAVAAHREANQAALAAEGVHLTYTAYIVRACVPALRAVPEANAQWHDEGLEIFDDLNIGIATALEPDGLIVPVLHRAQDLDLPETARRLQDLTTRARAGKLAPGDVHGGTFTISNHGVSGSLLAAPIVIVQPQSAILGVGKIESRVKVGAAGGFEARPMAFVTLTIDHRVLDGFRANVFLGKWVEAIERWA